MLECQWCVLVWSNLPLGNIYLGSERELEATWFLWDLRKLFARGAHISQDQLYQVCSSLILDYFGTAFCVAMVLRVG